jgi:hypothetical protein
MLAVALGDSKARLADMERRHSALRRDVANITEEKALLQAEVAALRTQLAVDLFTMPLGPAGDL